MRPSAPHRFYWRAFTDGSRRWRDPTRRPPGEDLAALRLGAGREPGTVPSLWPHHRVPIGDDWLEGHHTWEPPADFKAEHHCLTLYGFHQQSVGEPMHVADIGFGKAMLSLRQQREGGGDAVDRRFAAAATSTTLDEVVSHLRRLVALLRGIRQPLDYDRLHNDLCLWQVPAAQGRVRRRWGLQYYASRLRDADEGQDGSKDHKEATQGNGART